jgi:hypothetical protein
MCTVAVLDTILYSYTSWTNRKLLALAIYAGKNRNHPFTPLLTNKCNHIPSKDFTYSDVKKKKKKKLLEIEI